MALPFQPVDTEALVREMRLVERGEADGRANIPTADATGRSSTEAEIVQRIEAERARLAEDAIARLRAQSEDLAQIDTVMDVAGLRSDADHAIARLRELHHAWQGEIDRLLREARAARKELDEFRIAHGLRRDAVDPGHRLLAWGLLSLAVAVESALNGFFFAEGSDLGLVGGIALALGISVVNVVVFGFALGLGPARWRNHRFLPLRAIAWLLLLAGGVLVLLANAFVAHYRDAFERAGEAVELASVRAHLVAEPFALARMQSWLLFFLGLAFAVLGFWKGYHHDDPYPGYGRIARRFRTAEQDCLAGRQERLAEAGRIRDEAKKSLDETIERVRGADMRRRSIAAARSQLEEQVRSHEEHLRQAGDALLRACREANMKTRTQPPPAHFSKPFNLPDRILERPNLRRELDVKAPAADPEAIVAELDRRRQLVLDAYQDALAAVPPETV